MLHTTTINLLTTLFDLKNTMDSMDDSSTLHNVSAADRMNRLIKTDPEITYRQLKKVSDDLRLASC